MKLFKPIIFIGTFDFFCFMSLSLTLPLVVDHKVSTNTKQKLLASFSCTFQLIRRTCDTEFKHSSWASWYCFLVRFNETWEISALLQNAWKLSTLTCIWTELVQKWYDRNYLTLYFYASLGDLYLQGDRGATKQKRLRQLSHEVVNGFGCNMVYCWFVGLMKLLFNIQGRELYLDGFV